jgi:hypothetical protein
LFKGDLMDLSKVNQEMTRLNDIHKQLQSTDAINVTWIFEKFESQLRLVVNSVRDVNKQTTKRCV